MAKPLHSSEIPPRSVPKSPDLGLTGMGMMGLTPMPVQREMWRLLEAKRKGIPLYEETAIEVPRRAGKTDGIFSLAVGRCTASDDYQVTYCAQSGTKSRDRFYDLLRKLDQHYTGIPYRARESRGGERFEWANGSTLRFLPPKAESFRGDALDWLILDEAQEVDPKDAADLIGAIMPVFDTRPDAQLTVAGTAGSSRDGLLWEALEKGRGGQIGILEYAAPEGFDVNDDSKWLDVHPGPAGVSKAHALAVMRKRRAQMSPEMFAREYLGIWPDSTNAAAFDLDTWQRQGTERVPQPRRLGLAFDVTPGGTKTAVVAVWQEGNRKYAEVIREDNGTRWAAKFIGDLATKYRVPVGYDPIGETLAVADEIARLYRGRVTLKGLTTMEYTTACVILHNEVVNGNLWHFRQPQLTEAVENAKRRPVRDGGWAWGRKASGGSIASLVAATIATKMWDDLPNARNLSVLSARTAQPA